MDVSIRGVDEETWAEFKSRAAKEQMSMANYLEKLLGEADTNWKRVLDTDKNISDETADSIKGRSKEIRETFEMR